MFSQTSIRIASWTLGIVVPLGAAWFATSWIRRSATTLFARTLLAGLLAWIASPPLHAWLMFPFSWAEWRCSICGAAEYQVRYRDRCIERKPFWSAWPKAFERALASAVGSHHEHDWRLPIMAIAFGDGGSVCGMGFGDGGTYFSCLAKNPSGEIAAHMIAKVASTPPANRVDMIMLFESWKLGEPFHSLWRGATPTTEEFEQEYVAWLDRHPEWR